jgi:hypothetical protein
LITTFAPVRLRKNAIINAGLCNKGISEVDSPLPYAASEMSMLSVQAAKHKKFDGGKDRKGDSCMKKSKYFVAGMAALLLSFGLVLAGCEDPNGSGTGDQKRTQKSGTIKLTDTGNNTFTITLTGFVFKDDLNYGYIVDAFELDGEVTAEGVDSVNPKIYGLRDIKHTIVRTSDTVLTVTMSQHHDGSPPHVYYYFGSGKFKYPNDAFAPEGQNIARLTEYVKDFYYGVQYSGDYVGDFMSVTADSGSVSFNIPKHVE